MEPAAVDSSIVDRDSPRGLHPEGTSDPRVATEQPKIPSRALGFHHRAEIAVERFEILIGSQPFSHDVLQVVGLFDELIQSSVEGCRKPEPRIYEIACERLGVEPAACVFLDDLGVNLKPARSMGMTTIKVVDPEEAIAELEAVVGFPLG